MRGGSDSDELPETKFNANRRHKAAGTTIKRKSSALPRSHLRGIQQEVLKSTLMVFLSLPGARLKLSLTSLSEETNFTLNGLKLRVLYQ